MRCDIRRVQGTGELDRFIKFPWKIYRGADPYPNWVPPLLLDQKALFDQKKHPFFRHAEEVNFLAYGGGGIIGRISGIIDHQFIQNWGEKAAYFGFYESIDDREVARSLFAAVEAWAREKGMDRVIGPISPTPNHILGLLLDDFDGPPVIQTPYNPPYYRDLFEAAGYVKEKDHYAYIIWRGDPPLSDRVKRVEGGLEGFDLAL